MKIKLRYLCSDVDRHGNVRFTFACPVRKDQTRCPAHNEGILRRLKATRHIAHDAAIRPVLPIDKTEIALQC